MDMLLVPLLCKEVSLGLSEPGVVGFFFKLFRLSLYFFDFDLSICKAVAVGQSCIGPSDCTSNACEDDDEGGKVCTGTYHSLSLILYY